MSDYHPETWNPMWSVSSILTGLLSFMLETEPSTGCVSTSDDEKRVLASKSLFYNTHQSPHKKIFLELFGHVTPRHTPPQGEQTKSVTESTSQKYNFFSLLWIIFGMSFLAWVLFRV